MSSHILEENGISKILLENNSGTILLEGNITPPAPFAVYATPFMQPFVSYTFIGQTTLGNK